MGNIFHHTSLDPSLLPSGVLGGFNIGNVQSRVENMEQSMPVMQQCSFCEKTYNPKKEGVISFMMKLHFCSDKCHFIAYQMITGPVGSKE